MLWALGCMVAGCRGLPSSTFPVQKLVPFSHTNFHCQALLPLSCRESVPGCKGPLSYMVPPHLPWLLGCFCASTGWHIPAWESVNVCFQCCVSALSHCCLQCKKEGSNEGHVWEVSAIPLCGDGVPHSPKGSLLALLTDSQLLPELQKDVAAVLCVFSEALIHQLQGSALLSAGR